LRRLDVFERWNSPSADKEFNPVFETSISRTDVGKWGTRASIAGD
jgi:hypothetical protein